MPSSSQDSMSAPHNGKVDAVNSSERVPGHSNYFEKDGLRTYGDDEDHDHEPSMSFRRVLSLVAMAFLWTGSQIPLYIFGQSQQNIWVGLLNGRTGGIPPYIYRDIGGADRWIWFVCHMREQHLRG
ncbi:MAG: hypothetical protein Q9167_007134 [Letrouitia subvulpina]